jgi:hypothetical protein
MVDQAWLANALETTGDFETAGDPWGGVTGDFDGMGLSCGVLQWNIGSNSLQPLVKAAGEPAVKATMPRHGAKFWEASNTSIAKGLAIVRAWQGGGSRLPADVKAELVAFMCSAPMVAQQMAAAGKVARSAERMAVTWAASRGRTPYTKRDFCWFFDLVTQNGGLKGLTIEDVTAFVRAHGNATKAVADICDWLAAMPQAYAGFKDCWRNAQLWRGNVDNAWRDLFILSYLRARKARPEYAGVVMNRKGTIALARGWVNAEMMNFEGRF